jgi:hypothetical protein
MEVGVLAADTSKRIVTIAQKVMVLVVDDARKAFNVVTVSIPGGLPVGLDSHRLEMHGFRDMVGGVGRVMDEEAARDLLGNPDAKGIVPTDDGDPNEPAVIYSSIRERGYRYDPTLHLDCASSSESVASYEMGQAPDGRE